MSILYDMNGDLIESIDPSAQGGWREGLPWDGGSQGAYIYGVGRDAVRRRTRSAFFTNPLFGAAVEIAVALLIGDSFTYAPLNADKAAQQALSDFWDLNDLGQLMASRLVTEYLLDGELCAVFPLEDPGPEVAARIAHLDMDKNVTLQADTISGITRVTTADAGGREVRWEQGQFVFTAHNALWNDPRGWPVAMRAVQPAASHFALLQHRLNNHELQGRILGVQKVFVDRTDVNSRAIFEAKANAYRRVPKRGGFVTLAMVEGKDGKVISDSLDFMTPGGGAGNAETDARAYVRLVALNILGMPEHYLGEGGTVTRTTADSMTLPAIRSVLRIHAALRSHLDRMFRLELQRRHGPDRVYTISSYEVTDNGTKRKLKRRKVRADQIEVPWVFPSITQDNLADLISRATTASSLGLASPQTLSGSLGFDPAVEAENMAAAGLAFGVARAAPVLVPGQPAPTDPPIDPGQKA